MDHLEHYDAHVVAYIEHLVAWAGAFIEVVRDDVERMAMRGREREAGALPS